jgi:hypothetical protein
MVLLKASARKSLLPVKTSARNSAKPKPNTRFVTPRQVIQKPSSASPRVQRATKSVKVGKMIAKQATKNIVKPVKQLIHVPSKPADAEIVKPKKTKWQKKVEHTQPVEVIPTEVVDPTPTVVEPPVVETASETKPEDKKEE